MEGKWWEIVEEVQKKIDANGFKQKWVLDPKGYFLIRVNKENQLLEVGHCTVENKLIKVFHGSVPEEIMYKVIEENCISLLDHAAYLGKELQKAYFAMKNDLNYVQDSLLEENREEENLGNDGV